LKGKKHDDVYEIFDNALDAAEHVLRPLVSDYESDDVVAEFKDHCRTHLQDEMHNIAMHGHRNEDAADVPKDPPASTPAGIVFSIAEFDTVLAALRLWGREHEQAPPEIVALSLEHGEGLTAFAVDRLCERINCGAPQKVFVTVSGGVAEVDEDTTPHGIEIEIVDFDNIKEGDEFPSLEAKARYSEQV
jgi:hypothetical protein